MAVDPNELPEAATVTRTLLGELKPLVDGKGETMPIEAVVGALVNAIFSLEAKVEALR